MEHPTIVLADDEPRVLAVLEAMLALSPVPCRVVTAPDGAAALDAIRAHRPHLAILDAHLPALSGLEVVERVRRSPDLTGTRLLLLTGDAAAEEAACAADGVLLKPCTRARLLDAVAPLLTHATAA